jgi:hypothetical protein
MKGLARRLVSLARAIMPPERRNWADAMAHEFEALEADHLGFALGCFTSAGVANFQTLGGVSRLIIFPALLGIFAALLGLCHIAFETVRSNGGFDRWEYDYQRDFIALNSSSEISALASFFLLIFTFLLLVNAAWQLLRALRKPANGPFLAKRLSSALSGVALLPIGTWACLALASQLLGAENGLYPILIFIVFSPIALPFTLVAIMANISHRALFKSALWSALLYAIASVLWIIFMRDGRAWPSLNQLGVIHFLPMSIMFAVSACGLALIWLDRLGTKEAQVPPS